jgi:creatinine amidohydrolase
VTAPGGTLARVAWPDLDGARAALLVVPLGSCEQHGPHLPLTVDADVATAVGSRLADVPGVVVAPTLPYGASGEHEDFPGTLSIGTPALVTALVELGRSASRWADRLLLLNGHGGNAEAVATATRRLRTEDRDVAWWPCAVPGDAHAGRSETSLLLALRPDAVRSGLAVPGESRPVAQLLPVLRERGVRAVSGSGVLGDPTGASAEEGAALLADLVARTAAALTGWDVAADGRLRAVHRP